jgi:hypothetical protein
VPKKVADNPLTQSEFDVTVVTHCDSNYLSRALSLISSLQSHGFMGRIVVFTHDEQAREKLSALAIINLQIYMITDLESQFPEIVEAKNNRPTIEYYYCITPFLLKYIQINFPGSLSVYLDADLYFFLPLSDVLAGFDMSVIAITPHRFTEANSNLEKYGLFNVGLVCFGTGYAPTNVLDWWANRCLESTSQELSKGVYGDQKYLDSFVEISPGIKILDDSGFNAAPWNLRDSGISEGRVWVESGSERSNLVFFHFSGLKRFRLLKLLGFMPFRHKPSRKTKDLIYGPYLESLKQSELKLGVSSVDTAVLPNLVNIINYIRYRDFMLKIAPSKNLLSQ